MALSFGPEYHSFRQQTRDYLAANVDKSAHLASMRRGVNRPWPGAPERVCEEAAQLQGLAQWKT